MSGFLHCKSLRNIWKREKHWERESEKWVCGYYGIERNLKAVCRAQEEPVETEVVGCRAVIWKPKFKTLGIDSLVGNNRELSEGPPCRSASWALTRLSDQPGNKSHGWVLNSLLVDPMQGAGDDWWEGFPVRLRDWRIAGTALFQAWDTRVNIIFSDTPFPSIVMTVFINISRKILKGNHYVSVINVVRNIFYERMWKQCLTV